MQKKTTYIWIILILTALGGVFGLFQNIMSLINIRILITPSFLNSVTFNITELVLSIIGTALLLVYFIKLYNLPKNIIKWTNIIFGYSVFNLFYTLAISVFTMPILFVILSSIPIIIIVLIIIIIWFTFVRHLEKHKELFCHSQEKEIRATPNKKIKFNKNTFIKIIKIVVNIIIILLISYIIIRVQESDKKWPKIKSPDVFEVKSLGNKGNLIINDKGQIVDKFVKGTFKVFGTEEIFEYQERYDSNPGDMRDYNSNAVNDCINLKCSFVYFQKNNYSTQNKTSVFNQNDNPLNGIIDSIVLYSKDKKVPANYIPKELGDKVKYIITYTKNSVTRHIERFEDLCLGYKGGGINCKKPNFHKDNKIVFFDNKDGSGLNSIFLDSELIQTRILRYQFYTQPDTGEKFPVVEMWGNN